MKKLKCDVMKYLLVLGLCMPVVSCSEDEPDVVETPKRTEKEITAFSIPTLDLTGEIDATAHTISLTVTPDYDQSVLESVVPRIEYKGVKIEPAATEPQNFTQTVTYKVTAEDGSSLNYTVSLQRSAYVSTGIGKVTEVWKKEDWAGLGFAAHSEPTIAYLNGKLVASRSGILLDAANGNPTGAKLEVGNANFVGTQTQPNFPFAVTNDDAGNVIGVALGAWTSGNVPVYKWTTSLESAPALVYEVSGFPQFGRKISVVGDVSGNGYIAQYNHDNTKAGIGDEKHYVWKVTGGAVEATPTAILARPVVPPSGTGSGFYYQTLIPMTTTSIYPFYLTVFGAANATTPSEVSYTANASSERQILDGFQKQGEVDIWSSNWGAYVYHGKKFDFNGVTYIAVLSVSMQQIADGAVIYYLSIMDTRTNTVVKVIEIPRGSTVENTNATAAVTNSLEETNAVTGEKTLRLYTLFTNRGVYCHEITNKP